MLGRRRGAWDARRVSNCYCRSYFATGDVTWPSVSTASMSRREDDTIMKSAAIAR